MPGHVGREETGVMSWPLDRKLVEAAKLAVPKLPHNVGQQFAALFSPESIAWTTAAFGAWGVGQFTPYGWAADLVILVGGAIFLGTGIFQVAGELERYVTKAKRARTMGELDAASVHLAEVVSIVGVTVFSVLLFKAAASTRARLTPRPKQVSNATPIVEIVEQKPQSRVEPQHPFENTEFHGDNQFALAFRKGMAKHFYEQQPSLAGNRAKDAAGKILRDAAGKRIDNRKLIESHVSGINTTLTVVNRRLKAGAEIIQYEGPKGPGFYCTYEGISPAELAILSKGRIMKRYVVTEPFVALESTAAAFEHGRVHGVGGKGGGKQLRMPDGWTSKVKLTWSGTPLPKKFLPGQPSK